MFKVSNTCLVFLTTLLLFAGCKSNTADTKSESNNEQTEKKDARTECAQGAPKALFSPDFKMIEKHNFAMVPEGDNASLEDVLFEKDLHVTIAQSGCDKVEQRYTFEFPGDFTNPKYQTPEAWLQICVDLFNYMSTSDASLTLFTSWANAIESKMLNAEGGAVDLGQDVLLGSGIYGNITRQAQDNRATVVVRLIEK